MNNYCTISGVLSIGPLINPSEEDLNSAVAVILTSINKRARTRRISAPCISSVFECNEGRIDTNGGNVCNSYGRGVATTSTLVIGWVMDGYKRKHVVVAGRRARAAKTPNGKGNTYVYPSRWPPWRVLFGQTVWRYLPRIKPSDVELATEPITSLNWDPWSYLNIAWPHHGGFDMLSTNGNETANMLCILRRVGGERLSNPEREQDSLSVISSICHGHLR